jgi:hypothetical protein
MDKKVQTATNKTQIQHLRKSLCLQYRQQQHILIRQIYLCWHIQVQNRLNRVAASIEPTIMTLLMNFN